VNNGADITCTRASKCRKTGDRGGPCAATEDLSWLTEAHLPTGDSQIAQASMSSVPTSRPSALPMRRVEDIFRYVGSNTLRRPGCSEIVRPYLQKATMLCDSPICNICHTKVSRHVLHVMAVAAVRKI
jgi:hypothetical protein